MPQKARRWWQSFGAFAVMAAILGVISLGLATIIYVIGMISVIGIPFALLAVIFPTLCLWTVISYAIFRIKPQHSKFGIVRSFMIALLIMLLVPHAYNFQIKRAVSTLQSGDIKAALSPLQTGDTLAVIRASRRSSLKCFSACIDLLLSGQVSAYVTSSLPRGSMEPAGEMKAMQHRLVRSQTCENPNVLPKNASANEDDPRMVAYHLKAAAKRGICIQSTEIQLADLGSLRAVVYYGSKNLYYPESLFLIDTQMRPSRIAVYEKSPEQNWQKVMQQTNISYSRLGPLLAHSISGGTLSSLRSGWWRENVRTDTLNFEKFLVEKMGAALRPQ
jgi:hypothetical protein